MPFALLMLEYCPVATATVARRLMLFSARGGSWSWAVLDGRHQPHVTFKIEM